MADRSCRVSTATPCRFTRSNMVATVARSSIVEYCTGTRISLNTDCISLMRFASSSLRSLVAARWGRCQTRLSEENTCLDLLPSRRVQRIACPVRRSRPSLSKKMFSLGQRPKPVAHGLPMRSTCSTGTRLFEFLYPELIYPCASNNARTTKTVNWLSQAKRRLA